MSENIIKYYRERAKEYEQIYEWRDPNRKKEQDNLVEEVKESLRGKRVLDIGCGSGYWTKIYSEVAEHIVSIDINQSVLETLRVKNMDVQ